MNTSNFRNTLIEIAEGQESNLVSKLIAYYYPSLNFTDRNSLFESLLNRLELHSHSQEYNFEQLRANILEDSEIINITDYQGKDFRIKEIEISNLRGIPETDSSDTPYGMNLTDKDGDINNAIILANNGVGKSSVFAGLEMIYALEIGEKKMRTLNPDSLKKEDYEAYLQRITNANKPICKIKTVNGNFDLENQIFENEEVLKLLNPQSHFVSEYDIIRNGQNYYSNKSNIENSIHYIVAESLGLSEYINCLNISVQIPNYRRTKETTARNSIDNQIKDNQVSIKNSEAEIQSKKLQLDEFKRGNINNSQQSQSEKLNNLNQLLVKQIDTNLDSQDLAKNILNYKIIYDEYSSIGENKRASVEKEFLEAGNELIHEFDNCPYCQNSNLSLDEIKANVEERLNALNQLQNLGTRLRDNYKTTSEYLSKIIQFFSTFYDFIEKERGQLSTIPTLNQILERESELYVKLAPIVNDEELSDYIKTLSRKNITTDSDFKNLNDLLLNNVNLFEVVFQNLKDEISTFVQERKENIENEIQNLMANNVELTVEQSIKNLENEIKELNERIKTATDKNEQLEPELIKANKKVEFVNQLKEEIVFFNNKLELKVNEIVENGFTPFKEPVEEIMNDYFHDDPRYKLQITLKDSPIVIDGDEYNSKIIVAEIIDKDDNDMSISPDHYFNTFRYKLFNLMISLSIALASRKMYKVNLPLVIDDLFYGSDFVSKNTFSEFIQKLILLFKKHTPEMPLQIILFTHDDFIYKSSIDGIENYALSNKDVKLDDYLLSRMFAIDDKELAETTTGNKFWNLIYD